MKRARHWSGFLALVALATPAIAAPEIVVTPPPFVQRVVLTDFLLVETNNDVALAPSNLLVIYFPDFARPNHLARGVALRRATGDKWLVTYVAAVPPGEPGQFRREEQVIEPVIARNVLAVMRHLLEINVLPPRAALYQASPDDDAWILLRDRQTPLSGVVLNSGLRSGNPEDVRVYRDLCAGLVGLFVASVAERQEILAQLDRFAATYVEAKNLLHR